MARTPVLHVVLGAIGVGALLAYLLACRPAWSPDGTKLLFPYVDAKSDSAAIALFDKAEGKTRSIYVVPRGSAAKPPVVWTQWQRDGQRAIAVWVQQDGEESGTWHVDVLSLKSPKPVRTFVLPNIDPLEVPVGFPLPEAQGALFIGGKQLIRLDLQSGDVQRVNLNTVVHLLGVQDQVYYCTQKQGAAEQQIGTVDLKTLAMKPIMQLKKEEGELALPLGAATRDGSRIAIPAMKEKTYEILVLGRDKVQQRVPWKLPEKTEHVGDFQWSADGKTIYAPLSLQKGGVQLAIGEIAVDSGEVRVTPLVRLKRHVDEILFLFQIALSPDGKTLATATTMLRDDVETPADAALYLIDLTTPERKVTKVAPPGAD
jgi:hypothetical protein